MLKLYDQLARIADSEASVLILGESGTGKEVVARGLHRHGKRRESPFVAVNVAALPDTLLESELFGHVKGAFTDARNDRKGLFALAEGGTLFLDEIGEMPPATQPKLLRALEEGKIRPIGSEKEVAVNVRVLAATNRDLETAVDEGRFRKDLYYRIDVIQVDLPPLRAGAPTPCSWHSTSSRFMRCGPISWCKASPKAWPRSCWLTPGRGMSASCAMWSNGPWPSPASTS